MIYFDFLPEQFPDWLFIVLLVIASLIVLWIITFIVSISFTFIFKKKLKSGSNAVNMLLDQRLEIMNVFLSFAKQYKIKLSPDDVKNIALLERIHDFQKLSKEDRDYRVLTFVHSSYNIIAACESSSKLVKDPLYPNKLVEFNDIEESYRQKSALYNSDVIGYNYWVNVPTVKSLFKLFGLKNKDLIV